MKVVEPVKFKAKKAEVAGIKNKIEVISKILNGTSLDEVYLPHYEEPRFVGDARDYPFVLNSYKLMTHAEGRGANVPALQKRLGLQLFEKWDSWIEINSKKAREMGIKDGGWVYVESQVGKVKVRARLHPGARPDVVNMPFEHGHNSMAAGPLPWA